MSNSIQLQTLPPWLDCLLYILHVLKFPGKVISVWGESQSFFARIHTIQKSPNLKQGSSAEFNKKVSELWGIDQFSTCMLLIWGRLGIDIVTGWSLVDWEWS